MVANHAPGQTRNFFCAKPCFDTQQEDHDVKAAEQGHAGAQRKLGSIYEHNARGVPQDYAQARSWYLKAAEQGDADAQFSLGLLYGNGFGGVQDYVAAYMWNSLSAKREIYADYDYAAEQRRILADEMTPEQIAEAQTLASEWKPTTSAQTQ